MTARESLFSFPEVNELWRSLEPRDVARNRVVRIERVDAEFAYVKSFIGGAIGRRSRIHRSRFDGVEFERLDQSSGRPW